jgi:hypothetical protein
MKTNTAGQPKVDLERFSGDPAIAQAVRERLAKLRARQARHGKCLIRMARELRRKLIKDAMRSQSN